MMSWKSYHVAYTRMVALMGVFVILAGLSGCSDDSGSGGPPRT